MFNNIRKQYWITLLMMTGIFGYTEALADGLVMLEQGKVKDAWIGTAADTENLRYEKNTGQYRSVTFNWGNKEFARFTGQVKFDSENKITNYALGYIFDDGDRFSIRSFSMSDRLLFTDQTTGTTSVVDGFNGKMNEITYLHVVRTSAVPDFYGYPKLALSYGTSTMPSIIGIDNLTGSSPWVIDTAPQSTFYQVGFRLQSLQNMIDKKEKGFTFFADEEFKLGYMNQKLSQRIYDTSSPLVSHNNLLNSIGILDGPNYVNSLGIKGAAGSAVYWGIDMQLGFAYLLKVGDQIIDIHAGGFWYLTSPLGANKTDAGTSWRIGSTHYQGFFVGTAFSF